MNPGLLQLQNQVNIAKWRMRWALQGGSSYASYLDPRAWRAVDLMDSRPLPERTKYARLMYRAREAKRYLRDSAPVIRFRRRA